MSKLLLYMIKEEWRIHSLMFGSLNFALFPVMIFGIACMGSFLLPLIRASLPAGNLGLILHSNYLLLGFMVGAFGLLGNEVMNRRFGQASLIAYAARTLPLSDRRIFSIFVVKDTLYYFILWVFPFAAGFFITSPFIGYQISVPIILTITLTLSFLFGLSSVFFLSMVYIRSQRVLILIFVLLTGGIVEYSLITGKNPVLLFFPIMLLNNFSVQILGVCILFISMLFAASILLFTPANAALSRHYQNQMKPLISRLFFLPYPSLVAKDLIDLYRSGSAVGQTLFSFLLPLVVIWFFLSLTSGYLPLQNLLFLFSITTGVIASTMYTWLTSFDNFQSYSSLPVDVRRVIISKISTFTLLQIIPVFVITGITIYSGLLLYLIQAVVLSMSISFFSLSVTIWLTGLSPAVLVYDIRVMTRYFALLGIVSALFCSLAFAQSWLAITSLLLFIPASVLIKRGFIIWKDQEQPSF